MIKPQCKIHVIFLFLPILVYILGCSSSKPHSTPEANLTVDNQQKLSEEDKSTSPDRKKEDKETTTSNTSYMYDLGVEIAAPQEEKVQKKDDEVYEPTLAIIKDAIEKSRKKEKSAAPEVKDVDVTEDSYLKTSLKAQRSEFSVVIDSLREKINFLENNIKSDLALMRSENLKLMRRISELERKIGKSALTGAKTAGRFAAKSEKSTGSSSRSSRIKNSSIGRASSSTAASAGAPSTYRKKGSTTSKKPSFKTDFDVKKVYNDALKKFQERRYRAAIYEFQTIVNTVSPTHELADNSQYWIGECYYQLRSYQKAVKEMEKVFNYPKSNKLDAALVISGLAYKRMGNTRMAVEQFIRILKEFPESQYKRVAVRELKKLRGS